MLQVVLMEKIFTPKYQQRNFFARFMAENRKKHNWEQNNKYENHGSF